MTPPRRPLLLFALAAFAAFALAAPLVAQTPEAPPAATPAPASANPDAVTFTLQLEEQGGAVTGRAATLDFEREKLAVLKGNVELTFKDLKLRADEVRVDLTAQEVTAEGHVVLDQGPRRLSGQGLTFHLQKKTGTMREATAYVAPDYYFSGSEIAKVDENVYTVTNGVFTSCAGDVPDWSFKVGSARIEVDAYARIKNASFRIKKAPLLYTPYMIYPTKQDRASGLLVPNIGYSKRRGAYLGLAYFQELGRSYDTTVYLDAYSEGFVGVGNEWRYRPSEGTEGEITGYVIRDPDSDDWRWKIDLDHVTRDLPFGMRGVLDVTQYSDFQFFQDFERDFDRNSRRFLESRGFITGNWGPHLFNVTASEREVFSRTFTGAERRLPDLSYRLRSTKLGKTPLYLRVDSSLSYLQAERSPTYDASYGRADLFPELSLPLSPAPWLAVTATAGQRLTWWGESLELDPARVAATGSELSGESLDRSLTFAGASIIGPSFSKVFESPKRKVKHIVEPRIQYSFVSDFDEEDRIARFDEVEGRFSGHTTRFSLINRFKAKGNTENAVAREVMSFEISQLYSLDEERPLQVGRDTDNQPIDSQGGPIEVELRIDPRPGFSIRAEWSYNTLFNELAASSLAGNWRKGHNDFDLRLTTRFNPRDGETTTNQLRAAVGVALKPNRLQLRASLNYDLEASELQEQRYFVDYTSDCYSLRLEFREFQAGLERESDYRVAFTLKNVGTFLDLTGRTD